MHLSEMPGASDIMHMRAWRGDWFGFYNSSLWRGLVFGERPKHHALNFIETFSPDGGDGSLEILLLVAVSMFVAAIGLSLRSPVK